MRFTSTSSLAAESSFSMTALRIFGSRIVTVAICALAGFPLLAADPVKNPNDLAQYDRVIDAADREHWAYRPITRQTIGPVKNAEWVANPIDNFILGRLEELGWEPNPPA